MRVRTGIVAGAAPAATVVTPPTTDWQAAAERAVQRVLAALRRPFYVPPAPNRLHLPRIWELDALRGVAVALMLTMHSVLLVVVALPWLAVPLLAVWRWLLVTTVVLLVLPGVQAIATATQHQPATVQLLALAVVLLAPTLALLTFSGYPLFLFIMGLTMSLSDERTRGDPAARATQRSRYARRGGLLLALAAAVTAVSFWLAPAAPYLFGMLHLLAVALLAYPLVYLAPVVAGLAGLAGLLGGAPLVLAGYRVPWLADVPTWVLPFGVASRAVSSVEYTPLVPWLGMLLAGIAAGRWLFPHGSRAYATMPATPPGGARGLAQLGQYALPVYLLQLPLMTLYGAVWV